MLMLLACLPLGAAAETIPANAEYVEGEIIISSTKSVENSCGVLHSQSEDSVYIDFDKAGIESLEEIETYSEADNVYVAEIDGSVEKACRELNKNGNIVAEPNYILHSDSFTMPAEITRKSDVYTKYQKWYLNDIIKAPEAWQKYEVTGKSVTIAIVDTGFFTGAEDFPTNLWLNSKGTPGWNTYENNSDISPIYKKNGTAFDNTNHGSNIAGVIGMASNGAGGIGASYGAKLMLLKAANYNSENEDPTFTTEAVVSALDFARKNGADIINMSLGTTGYIEAIANAVTRAYNAGILVVASAGNEAQSTNESKNYPAALKNVLGVMATGMPDSSGTVRLADFSNYNSNGNVCYEVAAPGVQIVGCGLSSSGFVAKNGTSQATALISSLAALYLEKHPSCTVQELKSAVVASSTSVLETNSSGVSYKYNTANALDFLKYGEPSVPQKGKVRSVTIGDIALNYKGSAKLNPVITADNGVSYKVSYKSSNTAVATVDGNGNVYGVKDWIKTSATITCTVTDQYGNTVSDTCTVKVGYAWWQWIIGIVLFGWIWY